MKETMVKFPFGETETLFENMKIMKMKIPQEYTPENEHSPWKGTIPKGKLIFQPSFFRGYVNFRGSKQMFLKMPNFQTIFSIQKWSVKFPEVFPGVYDHYCSNRFLPSIVPFFFCKCSLWETLGAVVECLRPTDLKVTLFGVERMIHPTLTLLHLFFETMPLISSDISGNRTWLDCLLLTFLPWEKNEFRVNILIARRLV